MHKNLLVCFLEPVEFPVAINWNSNHFRATGWTDEWILPQKFAFFWLAVHVLQETPLKSVCIHVFGLKWKNHRTGFNDNNLIDHQSCYIVQKNVCKDFDWKNLLCGKKPLLFHIYRSDPHHAALSEFISCLVANLPLPQVHIFVYLT